MHYWWYLIWFGGVINAINSLGIRRRKWKKLERTEEIMNNNVGQKEIADNMGE